MTYAELYKRVCEQLQAADCEDAAFDATCLLVDIGGLPRGVMPGAVQEEVPAAVFEAVCAAAVERAGGRPLQYILGNWDFLMLTLAVGEGVLIPRPDTELLCETAAAYARAAGWMSCRMLDLCSGSGCVALGTAALLEGCSRVSAEAVELSSQAQTYLQRNIDAYPQYDVRVVCADVLKDAGRFEKGVYQLLLSNPPYIPSADLPALQREVQREPMMALDGGDGYVFPGLVFPG